MTYVALLRGINVGGVTVKMVDLKKLLEAEGFKDVKTLLASGNALFDAPKSDPRRLAKKIAGALKAKYKRDISVIVRPIHDIEMLVKANPFKGIRETKDTRFHVTFLDTSSKIHFKSSKDIRVTKTCPFAICTVITVGQKSGTVDLMDLLKKHYGLVTTRNWNTVQKILKAV